MYPKFSKIVQNEIKTPNLEGEPASNCGVKASLREINPPYWKKYIYIWKMCLIKNVYKTVINAFSIFLIIAGMGPLCVFLTNCYDKYPKLG